MSSKRYGYKRLCNTKKVFYNVTTYVAKQDIYNEFKTVLLLREGTRVELRQLYTLLRYGILPTEKLFDIRTPNAV